MIIPAVIIRGNTVFGLTLIVVANYTIELAGFAECQLPHLPAICSLASNSLWLELGGQLYHGQILSDHIGLRRKSSAKSPKRNDWGLKAKATHHINTSEQYGYALITSLNRKRKPSFMLLSEQKRM